MEFDIHNTSLEELIQYCEDLYHDLELSYVKKWKEKKGAKAIGFMPVCVPRELIHAAGMLPVGIMGGIDGMEVVRGNAYFQSYICQIPRSTLELALTGKLDCLDGMIFPSICDVVRNMSGMWKLMFPQKYVKYLDLPQNREKQGREFYSGQLECLKKDFEEMAGSNITDDTLRSAIQLYNENRSVIDELYHVRSQYPSKVPSYHLYLLMRASNILEVREHTKLIEKYLSLVMANRDTEVKDKIRVVLTGLFCEQPPPILIKALENSGCYIIEDDWVLGSRYYEKPTDERKPLEGLVESTMNYSVSTATRYEGEKLKGGYLIERIKKLRADGVIFCAPSFCDPALLERPMLQKALLKEKIPFTSCQYSENASQMQTIREQTGTFSDSVRLWERA